MRMGSTGAETLYRHMYDIRTQYSQCEKKKRKKKKKGRHTMKIKINKINNIEILLLFSKPISYRFTWYRDVRFSAYVYCIGAQHTAHCTYALSLSFSLDSELFLAFSILKWLFSFTHTHTHKTCNEMKRNCKNRRMPFSSHTEWISCYSYTCT